MQNELWEVVRADKLKVGDAVLVRPDSLHMIVVAEGDFSLGEDVNVPMQFKLVGGTPFGSLEKATGKFFCRYSGPSPEVLMRAMRLMHFALYDEKLHVPMAGDPQNYIRQAEAEIEAETKGGAK